MHSNLLAEIARKGLFMKDVYTALGISRNAFENKLYGSSRFTIDEALFLHENFFSEYELRYLFSKETKAS